jgi:hypothetical protein
MASMTNWTDSNSTLVIRPASKADGDGIWSILEPTLRAGETYNLP